MLTWSIHFSLHLPFFFFCVNSQQGQDQQQSQSHMWVGMTSETAFHSPDGVLGEFEHSMHLTSHIPPPPFDFPPCPLLPLTSFIPPGGGTEPTAIALEQSGQCFLVQKCRDWVLRCVSFILLFPLFWSHQQQLSFPLSLSFF